MTCFWDGILYALTDEDYALLGEQKHGVVELIQLLKRNNRRTTAVTWNGMALSEQLLDENQTAVTAYDISGISQGHLCSTCDYMLLLICELFRLNIIHVYNGNRIEYRHLAGRKTLEFSSDTGHFIRNSGILPAIVRDIIPSGIRETIASPCVYLPVLFGLGLMLILRARRTKKTEVKN